MITLRSNGNLNKKKPLKVVACLITLTAFLFNTVSYDAALLRPLGFVGQAWAVGAPPSEVADDGPNNLADSSLTKNLNVANFTLPEYLGHVKDSYITPKTDKVIIHIQDAHVNDACQHRISEIIAHVNKKYGIVSVNLEGGAKGYDLSPFTGISDKIIRNKVADYFVKEGLVNGAEYFAVNNPDKTDLWGVEDVKLYLDGLAVYRNSLRHKEEIDRYLRSLSQIISILKTRIYSKELLDFDMKYGAYKANNIEFKEYLSYLLGAAKAKGIDTKKLTNVYLLDRALAKETTIDFKKANRERDELIDNLQKKLSRNAIEELVMKTMEFKQERISQKNFYAYLADKAKKADIDMAAFPDLRAYIAYISIYGAMDQTKVMDEKDKLEDAIKGMLCQNDKEKELSLLSKNLAILKNIFDISLARDDYRYYLTNKDSFRISRYAAFIGKEALIDKITAELDKNASDLDQYCEEISKFYEYSIKRDEAFLKNMKYVTRDGNKRAAILVTGGFHNENLTDIFKREGISYVSIIPNFKNDKGYKSPYFKILSGKESDLIASLDGALGAMQVASLYNTLGIDVYGEREVEIARLLPSMIAYAYKNGAPYAILTAKGDYIVLDKTGNTYSFSRKTNIGDIPVANKDMPVDTINIEQVLWALNGVGAAISNEEAGNYIKAQLIEMKMDWNDKTPQEKLAMLEKMVDDKDERVYRNEKTGAIFIKIEGLLSKGQFAHIGLGQTYGQPVVYIDAAYAGNSIVENHELEEIGLWQKSLDKELKGKITSLAEARDWMRRNIDEAVRLTGEFHDRANRALPDGGSDVSALAAKLGIKAMCGTEEFPRRLDIEGRNPTPSQAAPAAPRISDEAYNLLHQYLMDRQKRNILMIKYNDSTSSYWTDIFENAGKKYLFKSAEPVIRAMVEAAAEAYKARTHREARDLIQVMIDKLDEIRNGAAPALSQAPVAATPYEMTAENPVYVAFCMLFTPTINASVAKTDEHFAILARSFDVSEAQAREAVKTLNSMEHSKILNKVVKDIQDNLRSPQSNRPEFFFQNVLLPYLAIVSRELKLSDLLEEELNTKFREIFNTGNYDPLAEFVGALRGYLMGRSLHVDYLNNLNAALKTYDFRVEVGQGYSVGYRIAAKIEVDSINVGNVLILSRFGVSLLNDAKGLSTINEKDVVISLDHMNQEAEHIKDAVQEGKAPLLYFPAAEDMFGKMGIWLTIAEGDRILLTAPEANRILNGLYNKQFDGMAKRELTARIAYNTVVHETKHKWEEKNADMSRWNIDSEVSAHITAAIYGGAPLEGLVSLINRLELYYLNIEDASVKNVIRLLMQDAWNLAYQFDQGTIGEAGVVDGLKAMYNSYTCIGTGRPLPALVGFESEILPKISLQKIEEALDTALDAVSPTTPSQAASVTTTGQAQPSILADIIALLGTEPIDRAALVNAMKQKASGPEAVREMLAELEKSKEEEKIDEYQMDELEMALRTAALVKGLSDIEKTEHLNIIVQVAASGEVNGARSSIQDLRRKLERYPYNLYARSILEEGIDSEEGLKVLIDRIAASVKDPLNKNPRALLLLPESLHKYFEYAKGYLNENDIDIDKPDASVKIQKVEQGANPDFLTQFGLGFEILEYVRKGEFAEPSQGLLNLIAAMVEGAADPMTVLNELFKGILKIRKINWRDIDDQRKAWEAVVTAL